MVFVKSDVLLYHSKMVFLNLFSLSTEQQKIGTSDDMVAQRNKAM